MAFEFLFLNVEPYKAAHGKTAECWENVATNLNEALSLDGDVCTTEKNAQERFKDLMKKFKADEMEVLRASGTEEEFNEREQLLSDVHAGFILAEKKAKKTNYDEKSEVNGAIVRNAAVKCLLEKLKTPRKGIHSDENKEPPSSTSRGPSSAKTAASVAATLKDLASAFTECNQQDANDTVASRDIKLKELEVQNRKLALEEGRLELEKK
ncbi:hypothetical protein BCR33DRAFT_788923 [Rhizoclosmatium globosum]|uniref:Uncharacterized protein n=1 Tax=Rhizoclosmatium globosum TaxID=329046 RepID=A0A1Y2BUB0_9FUNG|nr:hypothetical protein BCR33DRAFT_788923 [Rhizoclosmatium globosum]|eukprot:ORY38339.1 hypothetical protein BCR33DRAFT_788923 [Rhizoclosmatium globosum]